MGTPAFTHDLKTGLPILPRVVAPGLPKLPAPVFTPPESGAQEAETLTTSFGMLALWGVLGWMLWTWWRKK